MVRYKRDAEARGWACAPPGSPEAVRESCSCPEIDNSRGRGAWGTAGLPAEQLVYFVNADCPLHGAAAAGLIIPEEPECRACGAADDDWEGMCRACYDQRNEDWF